jgi:predicted N-acetyltransferase YhbS
MRCSEPAIRKAQACDAPELLSLIRTAMAVYAQHAGIETPLDSERETQDDIRASIKKDLVLVATDQGRLIGTVRLVRQDRDTAWFTRFAVAPDRHRSGVGQKLLYAAEQTLAKDGVRYLLLHTALSHPSLVTFYQSRGFKLLETHYDRGYPRGLFQKSLSDGRSTS